MAATAAATLHGSLPIARSRLLGRGAERARAGSLLLGDIPLLTFTGPGGVGKTRLALAVAGDVAGYFPDGVVFVALAALRDEALVVPAVAQACGLIDSGEQPLLERLTATLRPRRLLLVLDNCEHLLPAMAFVGQLLQDCPSLTLLATSRERLRLHDEHEFTVAPLPLPLPGEDGDLRALADNPAVQLFVERAQSINSYLTLTAANAAAVAQICRRLDGLPLALELAAARTNVLPVRELLARLTARLPLLVDGARDAPQRQRTLRETIAWSNALLSEQEQAFFRRLAVFVGGFTLEAAEGVAQGMGTPASNHAALEAPSVLTLVASLVDKHLLQRGGDAETEPRFSMLETVREFALEQLAAQGQLEELRQRHAAFFLKWAETVEPHLQTGSRDVWLRRLEADHDNLRAALVWGQEAPERREFSLRLASALFWFWYIRGYLAEGRRWLGDALAQSPESGADRVWAKALYASGRLAWRQGDSALACARLQASVDLWRKLGDRGGLAFALSFLGLATRNQGWDVAVTRALQSESVALFREIGDRWGLAMALHNLGDTHKSSNGDDSEQHRRIAATLYAEGLALFQEQGDVWGEALILTSLGLLARVEGNDQQASAYLERGLATLLEVGDDWRSALALDALGLLAEARGNLGDAVGRLSDAAQLFHMLGQRPRFAEALGSLARLARRLGEEELAANLQADADSAQHGMAVGSLSLSELQAVAARLQRRATATSHGAPMSPVQPAEATRLTEREREVLRLIAAGHTNNEISQMLFISPRTASTHASHMLDKLGLHSRAELIAFAHRSGLV